MNWDWEIFKPKSLDQLFLSIVLMLVMSLVWYKALVLNAQYKAIIETNLPNCAGVCDYYFDQIKTLYNEGTNIICGCKRNTYYLINQSLTNPNISLFEPLTFS